MPAIKGLLDAQDHFILRTIPRLHARGGDSSHLGCRRVRLAQALRSTFGTELTDERLNSLLNKRKIIAVRIKKGAHTQRAPVASFPCAYCPDEDAMLYRADQAPNWYAAAARNSYEMQMHAVLGKTEKSAK